MEERASVKYLSSSILAISTIYSYLSLLIYIYIYGRCTCLLVPFDTRIIAMCIFITLIVSHTTRPHRRRVFPCSSSPSLFFFFEIYQKIGEYFKTRKLKLK